MRALALTLAFLIAAVPALARDGGSAFTGFQSLKFQRGARATALGGAYDSLATGADALFWNPAGMGGLARTQVFGGQRLWIAGIQDSQLAIGVPWYGYGAWALGSTYLGTTLEGRDDWGNVTEDFNAFDFTLHAALTLEPARWIAAGAAYKILRQGYGTQYSMGSAFDAGVVFKRLWGDRLRFSLASRNMGTDTAIGSRLTPLPWQIRGGGSMAVIQDMLTLAVDVAYEPHHDAVNYHYGAEYTDQLGRLGLALRAGWTDSKARVAGDLAGLALGGGVELLGLAVDYAWQPVGDFGDSHTLSLTYTFD